MNKELVAEYIDELKFGINEALIINHNYIIKSCLEELLMIIDKLEDELSE